MILPVKNSPNFMLILTELGGAANNSKNMTNIFSYGM